MNLNVDEWKLFKVGDLFDIHPTKAIDGVTSEDCIEGGRTPLVVNQSYNNGIAGKCNYEATEKGGIITFSDTWEGETFFYQKDDFIGFAHVQGMYPKQVMSENSLIFISVMLEYEARDRYSYGRKKRRDLIKNTYVKLPADSKGKPDWKFMDEYVKSLHHKTLTTKNKKGNVPDLDISKWKEFKVSDIFVVKYGVNLELNACVECDADDADSVNFVARTAENNGISAHVVQIDDVSPQKAGLISVAGGGSVLSTFLQTEPFYSGRDLYTLDSKDNISNAAKMFIITIIEQNKYKYSYGRQANKTLPDLLLKLPVDSKGKPDYKYMENYIMALPYGDRLEA